MRSSSVRPREIAIARLVTAAASIALVATGVASASNRQGHGRGGLIVYGYSYASRCPGAGIGKVVDRWGMYACNCTSYVAWALQANDQRIDWFVPGAMDAWNWPNVARRAGLVVDGDPAVGAVAVWPQLARPFGHVAYVTRGGIERDDGRRRVQLPVGGAKHLRFRAARVRAGTRDGFHPCPAVIVATVTRRTAPVARAAVAPPTM